MSWVSSRAVTMTMGTLLMRRRERHTSKPSTPGSMMSISTTCAGFRRKMPSAVSPLEDSSTSQPSSSRASRSEVRIRSSSSTVRMRVAHAHHAARFGAACRTQEAATDRPVPGPDSSARSPPPPQRRERVDGRITRICSSAAVPVLSRPRLTACAGGVDATREVIGSPPDVSRATHSWRAGSGRRRRQHPKRRRRRHRRSPPRVANRSRPSNSCPRGRSRSAPRTFPPEGSPPWPRLLPGVPAGRSASLTRPGDRSSAPC